MTIEHEELAALLPQKGKMFLIGRIPEVKPEEWRIESETEITENYLFYEKSVEGVPNYVCLEMIAQTVAALLGASAQKNNLPGNIGFILSVSNLSFDFDIIKCGQKIGIKAVREACVENVHSFSAEVFLDGELKGCGKLTAMEAKNRE